MQLHARLAAALRATLLAALVLIAGCSFETARLMGDWKMTALDPANLIRTANRSPDELQSMRDFVAQMQQAAQSTDVSATGVRELSIAPDGFGRWMEIRFRFEGENFVFAGGLLSSDVLVRNSAAIQFQPRVLLAEGANGGTVIDATRARDPWNALKAALALVARRAAETVGLEV